MDVMCSDGSLITCSRSENIDFFNLTIGGMGLTGLILNAKIQLHKIETSFITQETKSLNNLDEIMDEFVNSKKANTHILSHGLHFASVTFEGIRVYNKKPFQIENHLNRLFTSSKLLDIKIPFQKKKLLLACKNLIKKQNEQLAQI